MKAILVLFATICDYHEASECQLGRQAMHDGVAVAVTKVSDKKLSSSCKSLLTKLCVVCTPGDVVTEAFKVVKPVKSPVVHQEFLDWFNSFCNDFGAAALGPGISDIVPHMIDVSTEQHRGPKQVFVITLTFSFYRYRKSNPRIPR